MLLLMKWITRNKDNEHQPSIENRNEGLNPSEERAPQDKDLAYIYVKTRKYNNDHLEPIHRSEIKPQEEVYTGKMKNEGEEPQYK